MKNKNFIRVLCVSLILFLSWSTYHYWNLYNELLEDSRDKHGMEIFELARSFDNLSELFLYNEQPHELSKTFFGIANPHAKMSRINGDYRGRPISYNEFEEPLNYLYKKLEDDITKEESELIHEKVKEVADLYYSVTDTDLSEMLTEVSRERLEEKSNQALNILNELVRELEKY